MKSHGPWWFVTFWNKGWLLWPGTYQTDLEKVPEPRIWASLILGPPFFRELTVQLLLLPRLCVTLFCVLTRASKLQLLLSPQNWVLYKLIVGKPAGKARDFVIWTTCYSHRVPQLHLIHFSIPGFLDVCQSLSGSASTLYVALKFVLVVGPSDCLLFRTLGLSQYVSFLICSSETNFVFLSLNRVEWMMFWFSLKPH